MWRCSWRTYLREHPETKVFQTLAGDDCLRLVLGRQHHINSSKRLKRVPCWETKRARCPWKDWERLELKKRQIYSFNVEAAFIYCDQVKPQGPWRAVLKAIFWQHLKEICLCWRHKEWMKYLCLRCKHKACDIKEIAFTSIGLLISSSEITWISLGMIVASWLAEIRISYYHTAHSYPHLPC